jgi:hypothetical protein
VLVGGPFKLTLIPKALAIAGAFYFFKQHHKPLNQPLTPGTIEQKLDKTRSLK